MKSANLYAVKRALVVAPHPDDETIAAFGLVHHLRERGVHVRVMVVTDGAASHNSRRWPPARLAARRRSETQWAMDKAGVLRGDICFLGWPDSGLETMKVSEEAALDRQLLHGPMPDLVVRPSLADHHADHQKVALACARAFPRRVRQLTYLVWPDEARTGFRPRQRLCLTRQVRDMKFAAIRSYRTQTGLIRDDPDGFCMDRALMARFTRPSEAFGEA